MRRSRLDPREASLQRYTRFPPTVIGRAGAGGGATRGWRPWERGASPEVGPESSVHCSRRNQKPIREARGPEGLGFVVWLIPSAMSRLRE